ncbi:MAG TPA: ATP-binding protein [Verrucomicrobiae bacterium]|nr:ATP-binding protein [Verrucomicrobiae bacterium]
MNTRSLSFRLVAWYASLLTGVFILLGVIMYIDLRHFLENNFRETQARRAQQIADSELARIRKIGAAVAASEIKDRYEPEVNDRFIRVTRLDDGGSVIYVSGMPKDQSFDPTHLPALEPSSQKEFSQKLPLPHGETLMVAALNYTTPEHEHFLVEVGVPLTPVSTMLGHLFVQLSFGLPVALAVAIVGGYLLVRHSLRPVEQIARKAEQITQHNLSERVPAARTGDELEQLSISLNHMIGRLEDAVQNSKRFVADASHELRTPLTVLRGELENLGVDPRLDKASRDIIGSMLEEVERLTDIVEGLVALSRLDAGEAQREWVRFDLAELTATTADQMNLLAEDKGISVQCGPEQKVFVEGDRARLKQVVVNLLDNAIKYTSRGGSIQLNVTRQNGHAILDVADSGIGIPAESVPHVFDRFFRVDKARSRDEGGAGLGLSIVKSICTAHGAELQVESAVGKGSRFRIRLPLAPEPNGSATRPGS